jgi:maleate isomerase
MNEVSKDELASMDGESDRCVLELSDAQVDVMGYACLVAIMSRFHRGQFLPFPALTPRSRLQHIVHHEKPP